MTKADLVSHFDDIVADPRLTLARCKAYLAEDPLQRTALLGDYWLSASGGTREEPVMIAVNRQEIARNAAALLRFVYRWLERTGHFGEPRVAVIVSSNPAFRAQQLARSFPRRFVLDITGPTESLVEKLNRIRPNLLNTLPSMLPRLTAEAMAGRLHIAPLLVISGGEPLLPEHEIAAERGWGCRVLDAWGSTEVGLVAAGSGFDNGMLLLDDYVVVEPVDETGNPVGVGELAEKVFVTPLFRRTVPLIRYELADRLRVLPDSPRCGSSFRPITSVQSHLDDLFVYRGVGEIRPAALGEIVGRREKILEYQICQTPNGVHVLFTSLHSINGAAVRTDLLDWLRRAGMADPQVVLERRPRIERTPHAGKLRRFVPLRHP